MQNEQRGRRLCQLTRHGPTSKIFGLSDMVSATCVCAPVVFEMPDQYLTTDLSVSKREG